MPKSVVYDIPIEEIRSIGDSFGENLFEDRTLVRVCRLAMHITARNLNPLRRVMPAGVLACTVIYSAITEQSKSTVESIISISKEQFNPVNSELLRITIPPGSVQTPTEAIILNAAPDVWRLAAFS